MLLIINRWGVDMPSMYLELLFCRIELIQLHDPNVPSLFAHWRKSLPRGADIEAAIGANGDLGLSSPQAMMTNSTNTDSRTMRFTASLRGGDRVVRFQNAPRALPDHNQPGAPGCNFG